MAQTWCLLFSEITLNVIPFHCTSLNALVFQTVRISFLYNTLHLCPNKIILSSSLNIACILLILVITISNITRCRHFKPVCIHVFVYAFLFWNMMYK